MFTDEPLVSQFIDTSPVLLNSAPSLSQISKLPVQPDISDVRMRLKEMPRQLLLMLNLVNLLILLEPP